MRADMEGAIGANAGHAAASCGAGMHGDVLADEVASPDDEARVLALVGAVLGRAAQAGEGVHHAVVAELGQPSMTTCDSSRVRAPSVTRGPTTQ